MFTNKRLDEAFSKAPIIPFDDTHRFIIFSDCHRGDNSIADEFAHNQNLLLHALEHYYREGYTFIENGDGEELWEHAKFRHIRFAHGDIYSLIQRFYLDRRYLMIYGNHNMVFGNPLEVQDKLHTYRDEYTGETVPLLEGIITHEALILEYTPSGQMLYVAHGHQGDLLNDQLWWVSRFWMRYFWRYMHIIGFHNPASPAKNQHKRHKIERRFVKWVKETHHLLIIGHTHRPKFSLPDEDPYFNSGSCVRPRNITGLEIVGGEIQLIEWRIWPDEAGRLQVVRRVLRGPERLVDYGDPAVQMDEPDSR